MQLKSQSCLKKTRVRLHLVHILLRNTIGTKTSSTLKKTFFLTSSKNVLLLNSGISVKYAVWVVTS